jgi:hypothetical protein
VPRLGKTAAFIGPFAAPRLKFRNLQAGEQKRRRLGLQGKSAAVGWSLVVGALRVFPLPANDLAIRFAQNIQHSNDAGAIRPGPSKTACREAGRTSTGPSRLALDAPPLRGCGLDRLPLARRGPAKQSWLRVSETAPTRPQQPTSSTEGLCYRHPVKQAMAWNHRFRSRLVVIKARVVRLNPQRGSRGPRMRGAASKTTDAHLRYLERG